MKTTYKTIPILVMAIAVLFTAAPLCRAFQEQGPPKAEHRRFELTDEKIEHIMGRLAETDPEKAKELEQLRKKEPKKFKDGLRKAMREEFGRKYSERMHQKADRRPRYGPHKQPVRPAEKMQRRARRMREKHSEHLEWLEKNYPDEAKRLAGLKGKRPELYRRKLGLCLEKYGKIAEAAKRNPKLAKLLKEDLELKKQRDKLLEEIRTAPGEGRKKELVEELQEVVSSRFDLIVRRKQIAYERLSKRLEKLKERVRQSEAEVEKWTKIKSEKVKERLEELINQTEKFEWE